MERLTYWNCREKGFALPVAINDDGDTVDMETLCGKLAAYEDTGLEPEEVNQFLKDVELRFLNWVEKQYEINAGRFLDIVKAEKAGRLVVLPAETVFQLVLDAGPDCDLRCPVSFGEGGGVCDLCEKSELCIYEVPCKQEHLALIGKTVFLTREEAEAAMKKMKEES